MYGLDVYGHFIGGDMLEYILDFFKECPNANLDLGEDVLGEYNCEICYNCNYNYY